jgi:hypothetical protein
MFTYSELIRTYSDRVASGYTDADLNNRQRRIVRIALNVASNAWEANVNYPPTDDVRKAVIKRFTDNAWNAGMRALMYAVMPSADDDIGVAIERTVTILQEM